MLTEVDLKKMQILMNEAISKSIRENNKLLLEVFATKQELKEGLEHLRDELKADFRKQISSLREIVLNMKDTFDVEFAVISNKCIPDHEVMLQDHENRLIYLERYKKKG